MKHEIDLIEKYGASTILYDIEDSEFTTGTVIGEAFKLAGFDVGARVVINDAFWWDLTVAELAKTLSTLTEKGAK